MMIKTEPGIGYRMESILGNIIESYQNATDYNTATL
jgi:hypothetical protein